MITFPDHPEFITCYAPLQMFRMGIFGNAYFQIMPIELPAEFVDGLTAMNYTHRRVSNERENAYGIDCGSPLEWWVEKGLIHNDDQNGWVEWYIKFYYGRRHPDDARQIGRYRSFIARHMGIMNKHSNSKKSMQNLLQWAWDYTKPVYFK